MRRVLCLAGEAEEDAALAVGDAAEDGDVDFLGIVCALSATQNASAAMHTPLIRYVLCFIVFGWIELIFLIFAADPVEIDATRSAFLQPI